MDRNDKPLWLLDVDGVLNVGRRKGSRPPHVWPSDRWLDFDGTDADSGTTWPMRVSLAVIDFINSVIDDGLADVAWLTTWRHSANDIGATLGLPKLDVLDSPDFHNRHHLVGWWKLPLAKDFVGGRPLVWTDDDLSFWMSGNAPDKALFDRWPNLLVSPSPMLGLVKKDLTRIHDHLTLVRSKKL